MAACSLSAKSPTTRDALPAPSPPLPDQLLVFPAQSGRTLCRWYSSLCPHCFLSLLTDVLSHLTPACPLYTGPRSNIGAQTGSLLVSPLLSVTQDLALHVKPGAMLCMVGSSHSEFLDLAGSSHQPSPKLSWRMGRARTGKQHWRYLEAPALKRPWTAQPCVSLFPFSLPRSLFRQPSCSKKY